MSETYQEKFDREYKGINDPLAYPLCHPMFAEVVDSDLRVVVDNFPKFHNGVSKFTSTQLNWIADRIVVCLNTLRKIPSEELRGVVIDAFEAERIDE